MSNEIQSMEEIISKVDKALKNLYEKDLPLFQVGVHERTVTHKFAEYLQLEFKGIWNVDCEYNRDILDKKRLEMIVRDEQEKKPHRIFPDIIVHVRGKAGKPFNKLVIEIKTSDEDNAGDIQKLAGLTSPEYDFKYQFGLFIRFKNNIKVPLLLEELILEKIWFQNGKELNNNEAI